MYRRLRLTQVEGLTTEQAIELSVPSAKGTAPYSRSDLKYDMQTGLVELIPLTGTNQGEEHSERHRPDHHLL
jgi:hypothetical protein